jgi:ketosteroid isomerase-like protein
MALPDGTDIPATDKTVELPGVTVCTVRDGKIATMREYFNAAAMMPNSG